jgi:hypothetical protein
VGAFPCACDLSEASVLESFQQVTDLLRH